jgi:uncharacterized protein
MAPQLVAPVPRQALDRLLTEARRVLEAEYGSRLEGLVFHGSAARGTAHQESDVDLLVLLLGELDYWRELRRITELLYPLEVESGHLLSAFPVAADEFAAGELALYRNAAREGVRL